MPRKWLVTKRFARHKLAQHEMILDCGNDVRLQGFYNVAGDQRSSTLVIMIHGWEGCHESTYMMSAAAELLNHGVDVFRLNLRDHGYSHHLNRKAFNSTMLAEVVAALKNIQSRFDYQYIVLSGFSLGGNFALRAAADERITQSAKPAIDVVAAFCPLVNPALTNQRLTQAKNCLYDRYFVRKWKRSLRLKSKHWPDYVDAEQFESLLRVDDMNQALIPRFTDYRDPNRYFDAYAISGDALSTVRVPCFIHFAEDDMMIPAKDAEQLADNANLMVTSSDHGGHCGFISNWRGDSWQDQRLIEVVEHLKA